MASGPNQPELAAITEFLAHCSPFDALPEQLLNRSVKHMQIAYYPRGSVLEPERAGDGLRILRRGAVELRGEQDQLLDLLGEGENFNLSGLNIEKAVVLARFVEDSLVYLLPAAEYRRLRESHRGFDRYFHSQRNRRLRRAARYQPQQGTLMQPLTEVMSDTVLHVPPGLSILETARFMSERRVSSVLVIEDEQLLGIVTDRDLRSRAVAKGLDYSRVVSEVMTADPCQIGVGDTIFDATLLMTQKGIHHLPVMDGQRVAGVVTASDLMLARQDDPIYVVQHISRQQDIEGMQSVVGSLPNLLVEWVSAGVRADQVSRILTAISDAITQRLIEMATVQLGPAPAPFCWLAFGSQARGEQLLGADQDNGLLIADGVGESRQEWFAQLARFVSDGLASCGYTYCKGKVMATTDEWRQPLAQWCNTVSSWTRAPTPDAVMRVSIFFDLRSVYGDASLCRQLQAFMLEKASSNTIFLAALAENVLANTPPLGLFRRFLVERNGEHKDSFDLKKRGILPVVDMVRIHALANRITEVNTAERIRALGREGVLNMGDSRNLQDTFDFIMQLRIANQAAQLKRGDRASNYCNPDELTDLKRRQLRDAFTVVHDSQEAIRLKYRPGL